MFSLTVIIARLSPTICSKLPSPFECLGCYCYECSNVPHKTSFSYIVLLLSFFLIRTVCFRQRERSPWWLRTKDWPWSLVFYLRGYSKKRKKETISVSVSGWYISRSYRLRRPPEWLWSTVNNQSDNSCHDCSTMSGDFLRHLV